MEQQTSPKHTSSLEQARLQEFERACTQDEAPPCQAACPLHLDVRQFTAHMREGRWDKAAVLLAKTLPFALLLTSLCGRPCEQDCPRSDHGGPVAVNDLERACLRLSRSVPLPKRLPSKGKTVAILGSRIAALSAAWELSLKGYDAHILHSGPSPLDDLRMGIENAPCRKGRHTDGEVKSYVADAIDGLRSLGAAFVPFEYAGQGPDALMAKFDGLFVDTASFPALSPGKAAIDPVTGCVEGEYRICYGGFNAEPILQAFEGRRAAITLGRVLGKSSPTALRQGEGPHLARLRPDLDGLVPVPRVAPEHGVFTAEQARLEASRCMPCNCLVCIRECAYLKAFGEYPKVYARQMFLNMGIYTGYRRMNTAINSCALCRQCEKLCPDAFSMADLCLLMRREMVKQNKMPPSAHFFALQELAAATAPESVLVMGESPHTPCSQVFFPGCQLAAARSNQTRYMFRHLRQALSPDTGIWLRCCGIPAKHAARDDLVLNQREELLSQWKTLGSPRVILACASCLAFFREHLPQAEAVSLWSVLDQEAPLAGLPASGSLPRELSMHDPCPVRDDAEWQRAARSLAGKAGVRVHEPSMNKENTACCGYGGLVWNANPDIAGKMARHRATQLPYPALASCVMCREQFTAAGKEALHMFDVLLPPEAWLGAWLKDHAPGCPLSTAFEEAPAAGPQTWTEKAPGFSQRRENRICLKNRLLEAEYGLAAQQQAQPPWMLLADDALLEDLEQERILREDLVRTIIRAEADGTVFFDRENGRCLARNVSGPITFWVCYQPETASRRVLDAWMHRMGIELAD